MAVRSAQSPLLTGVLLTSGAKYESAIHSSWWAVEDGEGNVCVCVCEGEMRGEEGRE